MNFSNFTVKSQEIVQAAVRMTQAAGNQAVEPEHLLKAVMTEGESVVKFIFQKLDISPTPVTRQLNEALSRLPHVSGGEPYLSKDAGKVLERAQDVASKNGDQYVTVESLLMALFLQDTAASRILKDEGVTLNDLQTAIDELRQGRKAGSQDAEAQYQALKKYAVNLCERARKGNLDPVIGRDNEIRRVLQILSRRTKNNPILIGEPGTGKTAIVEGLAQRIVRGDVPENLKRKQVYSLDMGALMGAGKSSGAMDAANILKPALARGDLRSIGATTLDEYQKYFEKDKALERRFQVVMVDEPDEDSAIAILRGLKEKYENHHKVRIKDDAIIAAVQLSERYISDRFLPDKAIDLIDEAAAKLRIETDSVPQGLDEITRKIAQLEIERAAVKRDGTAQDIAQLDKEIAELKDREREYTAKWKSEKELINKIQQNKIDMEQLNFQAEQAERDGDYARVAEIRYSLIKEKEQENEQIQKQLHDMQGDKALIKEEVDSDDIAEIVSRWTGIPVTKMLQSEVDKLLHLEEELHKRVVGQDEAIKAVSDAVRRSRAGLNDPKRPIGSFIFMGTTGVGKTELAKALADYLFNDENLMTRIDMSEYQEKFSVTRLIGSPPGYVGYDEGGQLTEAVRRKPYSVVLFDEIEKAHPDVFNILLQVLDDGRLTDNKGRIADFKNTIIIMTSNASREQLRMVMRPEFLNRIDEIITFQQLSQQEIEQVVRLQLQRVQKMLEPQGFQLQVTDHAVKWLAQEGFDPDMGARPVKRAIQHYVLNDLSRRLLAGEVTRERPIVIDEFGDGLVFHN